MSYHVSFLALNKADAVAYILANTALPAAVKEHGVSLVSSVPEKPFPGAVLEVKLAGHISSGRDTDMHSSCEHTVSFRNLAPPASPAATPVAGEAQS